MRLGNRSNDVRELAEILIEPRCLKFPISICFIRPNSRTGTLLNRKLPAAIEIDVVHGRKKVRFLSYKFLLVNPSPRFNVVVGIEERGEGRRRRLFSIRKSNSIARFSAKIILP